MGLETLLNEIKSDKIHIEKLSDSDIAEDSDWLETPSYDLNRILSGSIHKGIPNKNLVLICGPEGTMKSSFMVLCAVEAQKKGYTPVLLDTERGINKEFCKRWGLDIEKCIYVYTPFVDELFNVVANIKKSGEKVFIGLDSIGGLEKLKLYEDSLDGKAKADQGQLQKEIKRLLKLLLNISAVNQSYVVCTSHLYSQPGRIPMPDTISGGKAARYLPSIIIQLKKRPIKDGSTKDAKVTGSLIDAITLKNRNYPPFQHCKVSIDYKNGINPYAGMLDMAIDMGLVTKGGAWFTFPDGSKFQGEEKASVAFKDFPEVLEQIETVLSESGYSTKVDQLNDESLISSDEAWEEIIETKPKKTTKTKTKKTKKDE